MNLTGDSAAVPPPEPSTPLAERYVPQSLAGLKAASPVHWDWLWQGYLAPGNVTLLTSLWKSGKTTLISVLLARMKTGGMLAGLPVRAGRAAVISEELPEKWLERSQVLDLDGHIDWFCQPFRGKPTEEAWQELLGRVARLHDEKHLDLLLIDSLANLSPMRSENDAVQMLSALTPLQDLSAWGVSTLLSHHPRKGPAVPGQASRGSGALPGFVDIILEMHALSHNPADRRRRLRAYSRHAATPANLIIEWTADGTNYLNLGTSGEPDFDRGWPELEAILDQADGPLTRRAILRLWPESALRPAKMTLWKWLTRAVRERRIMQEGRGTRREPFRYSLPGMAAKWQQRFMDSFLRSLETVDEKPAKPAP